MESKRINEACKDGNIEFLKKCPKLIGRRDDEGYYLIHKAIMFKQKDVVDFLYSKQKNFRTSRGVTCLMLAIKSEMMDLIVMFLKQIDEVDKRKRSIWHYVVETDNPKIFCFLTKYSDALKDTEKYGNSLIKYCVDERCIKVLEEIVKFYNKMGFRYDIEFLNAINDIVRESEKQIRKEVIKNYVINDYGEIYKNGKEDAVVIPKDSKDSIAYHSSIGNIPDGMSTKSTKLYKRYLYFGKLSELELTDLADYKTEVLEILDATKSVQFIFYLMTIIAYKRYIDLDIFGKLIRTADLNVTSYRILIKKGINSIMQNNAFRYELIEDILHVINTKSIE